MHFHCWHLRTHNVAFYLNFSPSSSFFCLKNIFGFPRKHQFSELICSLARISIKNLFSLFFPSNFRWGESEIALKVLQWLLTANWLDTSTSFRDLHKWNSRHLITNLLSSQSKFHSFSFPLNRFSAHSYTWTHRDEFEFTFFSSNNFYCNSPNFGSFPVF